ncbi:KTR3 [Symbiodinium necroappetens]|uniref:KTR3 protein n=1 Tax=Symbiodinium necroappetens TaxID=1628268 RepID=A0A812MS86_9DINO|nr:KTR3 [Symbiodinium necroappetens]
MCSINVAGTASCWKRTKRCNAARTKWLGGKREGREMYKKARVKQSNLQNARAEVHKFLQHHGIYSDSFDANVAKESFCGLYRTYPLHLAAKRETGRRWQTVRLLLHFGANPLQLDSRESTPYYCMGQIARMRAQSLTSFCGIECPDVQR